jgi:predicted Kef-type K+ transport protein
VRDVFSCLFFAAIGLHGVHPSLIMREAGLLLLLTIGTVIFKYCLTCIIMMTVFRYDFKTASIISIGLSQISEFVFVLASRAKGSGIISREVYYLLLGTTSLSMIFSPLLWWLFGPKEKVYKVVDDLPYHGSPPPEAVERFSDVELNVRKDTSRRDRRHT